MTQAEFNAWIRAKFNLWTKSDVDTEIRKAVEQALAQRTWVGLTEEERQEIALEVPIDAVSITEAKLKEKNT